MTDYCQATRLLYTGQASYPGTQDKVGFLFYFDGEVPLFFGHSASSESVKKVAHHANYALFFPLWVKYCDVKYTFLKLACERSERSESYLQIIFVF